MAAGAVSALTGRPQPSAEQLARRALGTPDNPWAQAGELVGPPVGKMAKVAALAKAAMAEHTPAALATLLAAFPQQAKRAQAMKNMGASADEIWEKVGAEYIPEQGMWIREIPDTNAKLKPNRPNTTTLLENYLDHPELYNDHAVGGIGSNLKVTPKPAGTGGAYHASADVSGELPSMRVESGGPRERKVVLHEVGHAIQDETGMPFSGANSIDELEKLVDSRVGSSDIGERTKYWTSLTPKQQYVHQMEAELAYAKNPGELMSYWTEERADMIPEILKKLRPSLTPNKYLDDTLRLLQEAKMGIIPLTKP
jgi:hypothetical protein